MLVGGAKPTSCDTIPILFRKDSLFISFIGILLINISPHVGLYNPKMSFIKVDFPDPILPFISKSLLTSIDKFKFLIAKFSEPLYLKQTLSKLI